MPRVYRRARRRSVPRLRRTVRKRSFPRRRRWVRRRRGGASYQRGLAISKRQFVKLQYINKDNTAIGGTGILAPYKYDQYKLNSAYDVNSSLATSAMPGYGLWTSAYLKYRVRAAKIKVEAINPSTDPMFIGIVISKTNYSFASWAQIMETASNTAGSLQKTMTPTGGSADKVYLKKYVHFKNYTDPNSINDDEWIGTYNSDPTQLIYGYVYVATMTSSNTPAFIFGQTRIKLYCEFFDPQLLNA